MAAIASMVPATREEHQNLMYQCTARVAQFALSRSTRLRMMFRIKLLPAVEGSVSIRNPRGSHLLCKS